MTFNGRGHAFEDASLVEVHRDEEGFTVEPRRPIVREVVRLLDLYTQVDPDGQVRSWGVVARYEESLGRGLVVIHERD